MDCKHTENKTERISKNQKEKLVQFMAANLEFARGQFSGINSNVNYKDQWESLKNTLNALGGSEKTVEQWKKCWIDLKCGVKKAVNARRKFMNQTGGGSWAAVPRDLNYLEEEILKVITVDAVDGDSSTAESGVPLQDPSEDFLSVEFLEDEEMYIPKTKKRKEIASTSSPLSTSKPTLQSTTTVNASKYKEALQEAREMQTTLINKLCNIENKIEIILSKINNIEKKINI